MAYRTLTRLLASTALIAAVPAFAQDAAQSGDDAASTSANEIIVTAQRSSQRLQDVPVSLQAISGDTLRDKGVTDLRQLSTIAPGLQVQTDNNYSIRGIGTQSFAGTIEGSVATAIDDVTLGSRVLNGVPLLDIGRIEVLNGPQGLLFGKNSSAGLVNITTTRPKIGSLGVNVDLQGTLSTRPGDNAQGVQARATINVPVSANSALRVSGAYVFQQPTIAYRQVGTPGRTDTDLRQYGVKAKYLLDSGSGFSLYLIGDYFESHGIGTLFDITYRTLSPTSVNTAQLTADGITVGTRNFVQTSDAPQYRDFKTGGLQGTASYEFGNGMVLSNTLAWKTYNLDQQIDADSTGGNGANINRNKSSFDQYSNELRLALPNSGPLTGQAGLYYFASNYDQDSQIAGNNLLPGGALPRFPFCVGATVSNPSPPGCARSNSFFLGTDKIYRIENRSYAAFGQLNYAFTEQLSVFAGGRVTHDKVSLNLTQNTGKYFVVLGLPNGVYDQTYSNTNFSWKGGIQYKPTSDIMLYATYGRGYKGPGMNDAGPTATANLTVFPETTSTVEAGIKSTWLDRKLTFNVSGFHTKFKNFQIQSFDPNLRTFVIGNAAAVTSKGFEATLELRPLEGLTLSANGAYADSRFDSYIAQCYPEQTAASCAATKSFDAAGYQLAFAPKFTSTVGAAYEVPLGSNGTRLMLQGDWYHRSMIESNVNHAPGSQIAGIDLLNASIGIKGDHWYASLYCRNCTNKVYPLSISIEAGDASAQPPRLSYTQRFGLDSIRTVGIRMGFNF